MVGQGKMNIALIIPARYGSTRFAGKPLTLILGKTMLEHVYDRALETTRSYPNLVISIATEDQRIVEFCQAKNIPCLLTSDQCHTGSDRVYEAATHLPTRPDFIVNLQGDAPFTPASMIASLIKSFEDDNSFDVYTPVLRMTWDQLEQARHDKLTTPFSGTSAIVTEQGQALWFSKNIIPALRKEENLKKSSPLYSPVFRHIGLYGYRFSALETFVNLAPSFYEELEGLEQLRFLENNMRIKAINSEDDKQLSLSGVDSPEDVVRLEKLLRDANWKAP
jgi:3-deoxy-manno-octulosonate cytidylyltransferase (CMP-KDO synthetase)